MYATLTQLTERYGERLLIALTDRGDVQTGVIDTDVTARALTEAGDLINGYLGRYTLPLAAVPGLLVDLSLSIAIYKLYLTEVPEKVRADYDAALRTLRDIASGAVKLVGVAGIEAPASGAFGVEVTDRERPFNARDMTGFI